MAEKAEIMAAQFIFHEINAFTRKGKNVIGNPAAICLVKRFPPQEFMQEAAKKLGHPMTSFVCKTDDPCRFEIRHFSPDGMENHVCGHATLAAAEHLAYVFPSLRRGGKIIFGLNPQYKINATNSFTAHIKGDDITLIMPAVTELEKVGQADFYAKLADALNIPPDKMAGAAYYAPRILNYVIEITDQKSLLAIKPDFEKLKKLAASKDFPHEGIMLTAKSDTPHFDILTRVFLPIIGVDEDVACGSANCSIIPYWADIRKSGQSVFRALFPYPPKMHEQKVGGIQTIQYDSKKQEIALSGQAAYIKPIRLKQDIYAAPKKAFKR